MVFRGFSGCSGDATGRFWGFHWVSGASHGVGAGSKGLNVAFQDVSKMFRQFCWRYRGVFWGFRNPELLYGVQRAFRRFPVAFK